MFNVLNASASCRGDTFGDQLAAPSLINPLNILQGEMRVGLLGRPPHYRIDNISAACVANDIAKVKIARNEHIKAPA